VRIVSASNRGIKDLIHQGRFREDFYYRLKVIDVELPPLRSRREDIPLLVQHFIDRLGKEPKKKISGVSEDCLKILINYSWPGNVRELENIVQRAMTLCQHEVILPEDLPTAILQEAEENPIQKGLREGYTLDQLEKEYIKRVLIEVGGNKSRAAEKLGLDRKTLYRKLEEI
jgi:transcriptional regulator with PAS, ATPase and Fis domain